TRSRQDDQSFPRASYCFPVFCALGCANQQATRNHRRCPDPRGRFQLWSRPREALGTTAHQMPCVVKSSCPVLVSCDGGMSLRHPPTTSSFREVPSPTDCCVPPSVPRATGIESGRISGASC